MRMSSLNQLSQSIRTPVSLATIATSHGDVQVATAGDAGLPSLVLIHGANIGWGMWYAVIDRLASQYHLIMPDLPGCGHSPVGKNANTTFLREFVLPLEAALQSMGINAVHIIGHSFGGWVAAMLAAREAISVRSLGMINSVGIDTYLNTKSKLLSIPPIGDKAVASVCVKTNDQTKAFLGEPMSHPETLSDEFVQYARDVFNTSASHHPLSFTRRFTKPLQIHPELLLNHVFPTIAAPVYGVWGGEDPLFDISRIKAAFAVHKMPLHVVSDAGHVPMIEKSTEFCAMIEAELSRL